MVLGIIEARSEFLSRHVVVSSGQCVVLTILLQAYDTGVTEQDVRSITHEHITLCTYVFRLVAGGETLIICHAHTPCV